MADGMSYVWHVFLLTTRHLLRRRCIIFPLLFLLLATILFQRFPLQGVTAPVQVGIALMDESGQPLQKMIESYSTSAVTFCPVDVETLKKNVAVSRWDCGLIVGANCEERLQAVDTDGLITLVIGEGSTVYPLVREAAAVCIAKSITPYIAESYLAEWSMGTVEIIPSAERVDIQLEILKENILQVERVTEHSQSKLLLGVLSAITALYVLLVAVDLGQWIDCSAGQMECRLWGVGLCVLPRQMAALCPAALGMSLAALILHAGCMVAEIIGLLATMGAIGLFLCRYPPVRQLLPLLIPLVCPIMLLYALTAAQLPVYILFLISVLLTILSLLIDHLPAC